MAEQVTVTTQREKPYARPELSGLNPLQAGILYGAAGTAIGGPLGLLAGLFAGVVSKRMRDSYLDREARDIHNLSAEYKGLQTEIDSELEIADPDEQRLLSSAKRLAADGWYRLQSGDDTGRAMIEQANEMTRGIMNADIQFRKSEQAAQFNAQRGLVSTAATSFRDQYSSTIDQARQLDQLSQRVLKLTADPSFDPNKPFNRAIIAELLSTGVGGMFKDDPNGFLAGVAEGGAGTIVGAIAQGTKTWMDEEEFKITREDYNRIALNARQVTLQYAEQRLNELRQQSNGLNQFAKQVGVIPQDYDLSDYVSGGIQELRIAPPIAVPTRTETKRPTVRTQPWRTPRPQIREEPQTLEQAPRFSDDWFRQKLGVPTQRQRRPTN